MTNCRTGHRGPLGEVPALDARGLSALRLAVAMQRDGWSLDAFDRGAYRSMARGVSSQTSAAPSIPTPAPPSEPTGELAAVMDVVRRAQGGDAEAFGELYDRYVDVVYRYIYYRVGNSTLSEDLTSETFMRALRRITSYTWQGRDFGAWLVTIARNLIADHFKSGRYRLEVATSDLVEAGADRREEGPEDEVLTGITNAALLEAVKALGAEQQECISLRFLQGLSVAETAAVMGKNEGAIKALQYRAVKSLARLLPEDLLG
ncbi:MAG TPA: ECF subfamily RNA polymerase sigma factor, BldN family [Mycobacteriales bacterium]|nr:ECF subfamily RNA polymerase sigma factor, BldN family [Mycobacteriales bacterium]